MITVNRRRDVKTEDRPENPKLNLDNDAKHPRDRVSEGSHYPLMIMGSLLHVGFSFLARNNGLEYNVTLESFSPKAKSSLCL